MVCLHDRDLLEVAHRIEGGIAKQATDLALRTLHLKLSQKLIHGIGYVVRLRKRLHLSMSIRKLAGTFAVVDANAGNRAEGDVGKAVLVAVEVGALQQG